MQQSKITSGARCNMPAFLVLAVMLLHMGADKLLSGNYINNSNPYATVVIAQFCVFILPCAFFCAFSKVKSLSEYNMRPLPLKTIGFTASCVPTLIIGSMLIKYISYTSLGRGNEAVQISGNDDFLYIFLSGVLVPAIAEEILLRGIVFTEYEKKVGAFGAVIGSAVLFAFIHFDAMNFLSYFYAGIILGIALHVTRSLLAPMILHFINNFICIYTDSFLQKISKESISTAFVLIMLSALLLLSLFAFFETLEWICVHKADKLISHDAPQSYRYVRFFAANEKMSKTLAGIFFSRGFLLCFAVFAIKIILAT